MSELKNVSETLPCMHLDKYKQSWTEVHRYFVFKDLDENHDENNKGNVSVSVSVSVCVCVSVCLSVALKSTVYDPPFRCKVSLSSDQG